MGRHPLSRTAAGKQIKDLKEDDKVKYQDVYRPPGIVRLRAEVPIELKPAPAGKTNPTGSSSLSGGHQEQGPLKSKFALRNKDGVEKDLKASNAYNQDA